MKEKILEILIKNNLPTRHNDTAFGRICAADEIMELINQEVEKRIAERMPSKEEIGNSVLDYCANPTEDGGVDFDQKQGYSFQCGIEWLRSRLTCSEKPNNSQKMEGGEG